jgi:hypothetical protein
MIGETPRSPICKIEPGQDDPDGEQHNRGRLDVLDPDVVLGERCSGRR